MTHISFGVSLIFSPGDLDESMYLELAAAGIETFEINASKVVQSLHVTERVVFQGKIIQLYNVKAVFR